MLSKKLSAMMLLALMCALFGAQDALAQQFSGTVSSSPSWYRPYAGTPPSSIRTSSPIGYTTQDLYVSAAGTYTINVSWSFDGYLFLYTTAFDANNQLTNALTGNDDYGGLYGSQVSYSLQTGTRYIIVYTSYSGSTGSYNTTVTGPGTGSTTPPNDAPTADLSTGSNFTGTQSAGFSIDLNPGASLSGLSLDIDDADMDTLDITVTPPSSAPSGVTAPSSATGATPPVTASWTGSISASQTPGAYTWGFSVDDGTVTEMFDVTLNVLDAAPVISAGNDVQSGDGMSGTPFALNAYMPFVAALQVATVTDANTGQTLALSSQSQTSGPTSTFSFSLVNGVLGAASNGTIQPADVGTHVFQLQISDGGANTVDVYVEIDVPANAAPEARIPTGSSFAGDFASGFTLTRDPGSSLPNANLELFDFNGDPVALNSVTPVPSNITGVTAPTAITSANGPHTITWSGTVDSASTPGDYVYTLELQDNINSAVTFTVTITVRDVPPRYTASSGVLGGDGSQAMPLLLNATEGTTPTFNVATVTDVNTTQTVTLGAVNASGSASNLNAFTATLTSGALTAVAGAQLGGNELGTHMLEIELTDGNNTTTLYVEITVQPNQQPTASLAMGSVFAGDQANGFTLTAAPGTALANAAIKLSDLDIGDSIEVKSVMASSSLTGATAPSATTGNAGATVMLEWTGTPAGANAPGDYVYAITIGDNVTADVSFDVTITIPDLAPEHSAGGNTASGDGSMGSPYTGNTSLNATASAIVALVSDRNSAQTLTGTPMNSSSALGGSASDFSVQLNSAGEVVMTPNGAQLIGTYIYELEVDDGTNAITIYVAMEVFSNSPPITSPETASIFTGSQGNGFTASVTPGSMLSNASLRVNDLDMDDIEVVSVVPNGLVPFGVTAPLMSAAAMGPISLTWMGTAQGTNAPGGYSWTITISDGNSDVSFQATLEIVDVAPTHTSADNVVSGDGSAGTPYRLLAMEGSSSAQNVAVLSDVNLTQVMSVSNVTAGNNNPTGGAGFNVSVIGGQLVVKPNGQLNGLDAGTHEFLVSVSDGGANTIDIAIAVEVVSSPVPQIIVRGGTTNQVVMNAGSLSFTARPINEGASAEQIVIVRNAGVGPMTLGTITLGGTDAASFVLDDSAFATSLLPGEQTMFSLSFDPDTVGTLSADVSFTHDATNTGTPFVFALSGEGLAAVNFAPTLSLMQGSLAVADGGTIAVPFGANLNALQLSLTVDDPNADAVSVNTGITNVTSQGIASSELTASSMATPYTLNATSGMFNVEGVTHTLTITADDGNGGTTVMTVNIAVLGELQSAPTITVTSALGQISDGFMIPVDFGTQISDLAFEITVDDANGDLVALTGTVSDVNTEGFDNDQFSMVAGAVPYTVMPMDGRFVIAAATHVVTLEADDGMGNITTFTCTFVVGAAPVSADGDSGSCSVTGGSEGNMWLLMLLGLVALPFALRRREA